MNKSFVISDNKCYSILEGWLKGPAFNSNYPHGTSQLLTPPFPGDAAHSHGHTCSQNTNAHKTKIDH